MQYKSRLIARCLITSFLVSGVTFANHSFFPFIQSQPHSVQAKMNDDPNPCAGEKNCMWLADHGLANSALVSMKLKNVMGTALGLLDGQEVYLGLARVGTEQTFDLTFSTQPTTTGAAGPTACELHSPNQQPLVGYNTIFTFAADGSCSTRYEKSATNVCEGAPFPAPGLEATCLQIKNPNNYPIYVNGESTQIYSSEENSAPVRIIFGYVAPKGTEKAILRALTADKQNLPMNCEIVADPNSQKSLSLIKNPTTGEVTCATV